MFKKHFTVLLLIFFVTQSSYSQYLRLDAATSPVDPSNVYQDANGSIGIGTATPDALTHVHVSALAAAAYSQPPNLFSVTRQTASGSYPNLTFTEHQHFIVDPEGHVGIGVAQPFIDLHVRTHGWNTDPNELGIPVFGITDDNEALVAAVYNSGTSSVPGGMILVNASPEQDKIALAIGNFSEEMLAFAAAGDGTVAMGFDMQTYTTPVAQLDIRKFNGYDYIMNVAKANNDPILRIDNDGEVGIGIGPVTGSKLTVGNASGNAYIDVYGSSNEALRFMNNTSGNSGQPRHTIGESSGNLLIDPGVASGGGNDKLKVDGDAYLTKSLGVGLDVQSGSTAAIKGSSATTLDLFSSGSTGWDNQIRFKNSSGTTRHVITDDLDNNNLIIHPGLGGGGETKMKVEGNSEFTGTVQIGNVSTPCTTNSCYSLYVEKGILAERFKCALKSDQTNWSDYVFDKDYKLMSITELERYVKKNHHLPNIPSAKEVYRDGIDLADMNAKLLEKIEELTLYVIQQQKDIESISRKVSKQ